MWPWLQIFHKTVVFPWGWLKGEESAKIRISTPKEAEENGYLGIAFILSETSFKAQFQRHFLILEAFLEPSSSNSDHKRFLFVCFMVLA